MVGVRIPHGVRPPLVHARGRREPQRHGVMGADKNNVGRSGGMGGGGEVPRL